MQRTWLTALAVFSCACTSLSTLKEAHPVDRGSVRFDVAGVGLGAAPAGGATAFRHGASPSPTDTSENARTRPAVELQFRFGAFPGGDIGVKTNLSGIELNSTIQLLRGHAVEVAVAPAFQVAVGSNFDDEGWSIRMLKVPVLTGVRFGGGHELVVGPAILRMWGGGTAKNEPYGVDATLLGGSVGISFDAGFGRIMPEVAAYSTVVGHGVALPTAIVRVSPDVGGGSPVLVQGGVAFAFGRRARSSW